MQIRFTANMRDMERELKRLQQLNDRAAQRMADAHQRASQQAQRAWQNSNIGDSINRQLNGVGAMVARIAPMIAGLFAGRGALQAAESWTKFTNSLKVAGVESAAMKGVQDALYSSAIKNGVALEPLGQLYGRLAQSQKELGATQSELLQFTNGVTAALRVQGGDAASASGALLQLSQALGAGTVRAEEFNSINEGARPILEAVARGSEKYGGSVAKLRAAVLEGKVASSEFFQAFLAGSAALEQQAAKSALTVGASMTNLQTALTKYIGETDASLGVTARISQALGWLAQNIDTVAESLKIVGMLYAATFLPALGRAAIGMQALIAQKVAATVATYRLVAAQAAMTASMTGMSRSAAVAGIAMRSLGASMAFFGGPIGLAIIALTAAVGYLGVSSAKAALDADNLARAVDAEAAELNTATEAAARKAAETGKLSPQQYAAAVAAAKLSGEVHKLADKYMLAAAAAKALRIEQSRTALIKSVDTMREARDGYQARVEQERDRIRRGKGMGERGLSRDIPLSQADERRARGIAIQTDEGQTFAKSVRNAESRAKRYQDDKSSKLEEFATAPITGGGGGKPKGGGGKGRTREAQDNNEAVLQRADDMLFAARQASADTEAERHKIALEALDRELAAAKRDIDKELKEGTISAATAEAAKAKLDEAAGIKRANELKEHENSLAQERIQNAQIQADLDAEEKRAQADALDIQADYTRDIRERHKYEREALTLRQQADDILFKVQQDQLALEREKLGLTKEEIERLRARAEQNREASKRNERTDQDNRQAGEGGQSIRNQIVDYANSFGSLNDQLSNIAKNGIADITNGLADAMMGAKSLKEAFSDMARSMIRQLIELAIRFLIFEALGMAFGIKGLGKMALGVTAGKNAKGNDNWRGGLTWVGESGPELAMLPGGTQIAPNNLLRSALTGGVRPSQSANAPINIYTTVDARDAVLTDQVKKWIYEGNAGAVQIAKRTTMNDLHKQQRQRLV